MWAATNKGLIVGNQLKLKAVCKALAIDKQGWIWVGTMNGVYVFDIQNGKTYRYGKEEEA